MTAVKSAYIRVQHVMQVSGMFEFHKKGKSEK